MSVGFAGKPNKEIADRNLQREISKMRRLAESVFPIEMMQWFGLNLNADQLGPCENYGVSFEGLPFVNIETYKAAPYPLRAAICFDPAWECIGTDVSPDKAWQLIKAFSITSSQLCHEYLDSES
jgi:hypothetical protein